MGNLRTTATRIAGALLLALALFGCDSTHTIVAPDALQDGRIAQAGQLAELELGTMVRPAQTPVDIHAVYSGPPNRPAGEIHLGDQWLYVEILDIEQHLPNPQASADDVRIGEDWATGTPAESYQVLDINNDGNLDIRLRWDLQQLVDDGQLGPQTTELQIWGQDPTTGVTYQGEAEVEVIAPIAMEDLVVVNDGNFFFDVALDFPGVDNVRFVQNVVNFENEGPRSDGTVVWWDRGRNSRTTTTPVRAQQVIAGEGFTVEVIQSDVGDRFLDIPANVRSIWLWTPTVEFTTAEINALKQFVQEGGRIMFIGENASFYGAAGVAVMNSFMQRMGVDIRIIPGTSHVGYQTSTNIVPHPLTDGVSALRWAGGGVLEVGPQTDIMFYDMTGLLIVGATEPIDPTPLTGREVFAPLRDVPDRGPGTEDGT